MPAQQQLAGRMQTIVYRYVLAQAGAHLYGAPIPPERIRMDYVYVAREALSASACPTRRRRWRKTKRSCCG